MKKQGLVLLLGWGVAGGVGADTVVYTDRQHPVDESDTGQPCGLVGWG
ncbi:exported hypothetical protein [Xenorhabdus cabanillasii JM26]|uniref:Uncharacterized protein n=1 Tax=Xenorhabdus cabanillasii JM26 TaxID=1427517 RepID=W1J713_9GAMM|nr:integrating conjugative element protein [Xenorhabdus cabanillasii JM26]CDL86499.1 exported hypothetical protein [Xenorhabdus cabanillasii JM26]